MATKLAQIVAYVSPAVKERIKKEVEKEKDSRITISSYVDTVLRKHFKKST
jgi:hypothetical protein